MREIRNQLAQDYQDDPEEGSHYLNDVFDSVTALIAVSDHASGFVRDRLLPSLP